MLDLDRVRAAYFNPPPEDPEYQPSREERFAEYERRAVKWCLERGGDPRAEGLGEHGALIGGPGKPPRVIGRPVPLEYAVDWRPLPLSWFGHRRARTPLAGGNDDVLTILVAGYLAGTPNRPDGRGLARIFRSEDPTPRERAHLYEIFACMEPWYLAPLLSRSGLSLYEIARAIHVSDTRRGQVVAWLNQFGVRPEAGPGPFQHEESRWPPREAIGFSSSRR